MKVYWTFVLLIFCLGVKLSVAVNEEQITGVLNGF
jgi:hypothetical protein